MVDSAKNWRPPLPREHGAWAMLIAPLLVGIGAAGSVNGELLLFALAAFGFFLLRYPLMLWVKSRSPVARTSAMRWSAIYGAFTILIGAALLLVTQEWLLAPIAAIGFVSLAVYLWHAARRAEMTTAGEWVGIAGLALGAPGAYLLVTHRLDTTAWALYLLNLIYFGGTVSYIKFRVREQPRLVKDSPDWRKRLWAARVTVAYHVVTVGFVVLMALLGFIPILVPLAFVLPMCKVLKGVSTLPPRLNIRRLGFIEVGFTTLFAAVILLAYWR